MGIKVMSGSMFATNNVMLAVYWHGADLPVDVVIPSIAVEELLRINEVPTKIHALYNFILQLYRPPLTQ